MKRTADPHRLMAGVCLGLLAHAWPALAATELQGPTPLAPQKADPAALPRAPAQAPRPADAGELPDEARVKLTQLQLEGCRAIACPTLMAQLGPLPTQALTLHDIEGLAQRVANLYKQAGYPFVQVIVPPQRVSKGVLTLRIIEGVLGKATVEGKDPLVPSAAPFLARGLPQGEPIREAAIERTMLLLNDQPGFKVRPVLRPGAELGQGDLVVGVARENHVSGEVGLDNIGSLSTGPYRAKASLAINSPFRFGDRLAINTLTTNEHMWLGSLDYDAPLGADGWRGQIGWARTSYQLGGAFAALEAHGSADTGTVKLSYPLLRSQVSNLLLSTSYQHKKLQDHYDAADLVKDKSSQLLILAAQFDHRDGLLGGGVSYGQVSLSTGHLQMDAASQAIDDTTAHSAGHFTKANLDVARIQRLTDAFSAYGRLSAQWAPNNLDSSEKFGLGGFLGVRAYPLGEATGDKGWLGQFELRWSAGDFTPFVFADAGQVKLNAHPWDDSIANQRSIAGAGIGVRWGHQGWSVESTLAGRLHGGASQAETPDQPVRFFVTLSRRFE